MATGLEVTQAIQNLANQMPLVSGRLTAVRVYLKTQNPDLAAAGVTGAVGGWRNGQFLGAIFPENGPIVGRPSGGDRLKVDDSLWFLLPFSWTEGEVMLKARVYRGNFNAPEENEPNAINNEVEVDVSFAPTDPLRIRLIPVHTHETPDQVAPDTTFTYQDNQSDALPVLLHLLRLFPVADIGWDASLDHSITLPQIGDIPVPAVVYPALHGGGREWDLAESDERDEVNSAIAFLKILASADYAGWNWYGMAYPETDMGVFAGWANSGVAHGLMSSSTSEDSPWYVGGGNTLAHEVGHNRGLTHDLCKGNEESGGAIDPNYPYPFPDCSIAAVDPAGYYGFDTWWALWGNILSGPTVISNDPAAAAPNQGFPFMGYLSPKWADPYNYCLLLDAFGITCDPGTMMIALPRPEPDVFVSSARAAFRGISPGHHEHDGDVSAQASPGEHVFVSVTVDPALGTGRIIQVFRYRSSAPEAVQESARRLEEMASSGSEVRLAFLDGDGNELATHALAGTEPRQHESPEGSRLHAEIFGLPDRTESIVLFDGPAPLDTAIRSPSSPTVNVIAPTGGGDIDLPLELSWGSSDPDGDALVFQVLYSTDDGETWRVLATNLETQAIVVGTDARLSGSEQFA